MDDVNVKLSTFLFFIGVFAKFVFPYWEDVKLLALFVFLVINMDCFRMIFSKENVLLKLSVVAVAIMYVYSGYVNRGNLVLLMDDINARSSIRSLVFSSLWFVISFMFIYKCWKYDCFDTMLPKLFSCFLFYLIIINFQAVLYGDVEDGGVSGYLAGNKFSVTYSNIYATIIYYILHPEPKGKYFWRFLMMIAMSSAMAYYTECSTSVIGMALLIVMVFLIKGNVRRIFYNPYLMLLCTIFVSVVLFFFSEWFLSFSFVKSGLSFLGESEDLTGRINIYEKVMPLLVTCPWYGYGSGNIAGIVATLTNCFDVQNGFFQLYLGIGFVGVLIYVVIVANLMAMFVKSMHTYPIIVLFYVILIISAVEIPFTLNFIVILSLGLSLIYNEDLNETNSYTCISYY